MKFRISKTKLLEVLQRVQNVVAPRSTLQILSNAMIQADGEQLKLITTDLDVSVRGSVAAQVESEGATTLPVRRLVSIVRELSDEEIEIDVDEEDVASLRSGGSFFKIIGLPMRDFPPVPRAEGESSFRIDQGTFREMLRKTFYAASQEESRRVLNGVLLAFKEGKLTMVATDGKRLALVEQEAEFPPEMDVEIVLPIKAVNELLHILGEDGDLRIFSQKGQAIFEFNETMLSTKLIDGVYPNYRQVIPSGCDERVTIGREDLLNAMRRVSLVTTEKSNATKLTFHDNQLTILTQTPEIGEARETLPIKYNGPEISVIFNPEYVIDPLRNLSSDEIYVEMSSAHGPALIKCDIPFLYVLMPLRID